MRPTANLPLCKLPQGNLRSILLWEEIIIAKSGIFLKATNTLFNDVRNVDSQGAERRDLVANLQGSQIVLRKVPDSLETVMRGFH